MKVLARCLLLVLASTAVLDGWAQARGWYKPKTVYQSADLTITQIAKNSFIHVSFLQTNDFGKVACNGMLVRNGNEIIVFDTPTNDKSSEELIKWIQETLHCKINAVVPTHFHDDCLGGLNAFHVNKIPSHANFKTIELAKEKKYTVPQNSFVDSATLKVGNQFTLIKFYGEGHTIDNVVAYYPLENILFGGCLIKEINATKGYLGDANLSAWSGTVEKIKKDYPKLKIVVPGHGKYGNIKLLDYTIKLFANQ